MSQTFEQYLRDEFANCGAIDFSIRVAGKDKSVTFQIHPTNRAGMTVEFLVDGNTLVPTGDFPYVGLSGDVGPLLDDAGVRAKVQASLADTRPAIPHAVVMGQMESIIDRARATPRLGEDGALLAEVIGTAAGLGAEVAP